jgi:short-subunit dehydrogenase
VIRFYETLRAELGSHVRVTILMPGYVVSNLTMGKGLQKDGHVGIDEEARDVINIYIYIYIYMIHNHFKQHKRS